MANTIDVKGAIVNITSTKAVKFDKMMGSAGGAGGQGKSAKFSDKGEFKNLGKFVVLVGQSLKKMNVNLLQTKKEITGLRKENAEKLTTIATAIGAQRAELKSFAKSQKKANKTLKDLAGKVGTSLELDKIRNKGADEDRKERRRDRAERRRADRESALEKGKNAIGAVGKGLGKLAKGGKNFLDTIMDFLGIGGFIASVVTAFAGYQILKKALNSNFVKNTVKGFMEGMQSLIAGIQAIPEGAFDKIGKVLGGIAKFLGGAFGKTIENVGKFLDGVPQATLDKFGKFFGNVFKVVSAFVGDRFKDVFEGLDKVIDENGNLKFDLGGIAQLLTGIGGLALTYRYIKNPAKVIDDIGGVFGFFGKLTGAIPGGNKIQQMLGMAPGGRRGKDLGTRRNPMHVYVVNQGGGGGGGLGDDLLRGPRGPGLNVARRFQTPRGSGINMGRNFRAPGGTSPVGRMGSLINESTGRATRMLGANKAADVAKNLKAADASKYLRNAVYTGRLSEGQALKIAKSRGPAFLKNFRGVLAQGGNLGRGLATRGGNALMGARQGFANFMGGLGQKGMGLLRGAKGLGQNLLAGALALPGNAMNLAKGIGQKAMSFGGSAVGGIKGSLRSLGEGLSNLNPMQALEKIKGGVGSKIDEIMKAEPMIAAIKNLKDPKKMKEILKNTLSRGKPALKAIKDARKAMGPFKIPGLDAAIGALTAAIEIFAFKQPAGNAALGAIGGILGSAAGTAVGTPGGPPGMFIGAMAGAALGELAGRAIARGLGSALPPEIGGYTGINGAPLFSTAGLSENPEPVDGKAPVKKARGGKIFGGRPTGDSVPAYLERGEYVLNRKAVSAIGPSNLDAMNFGMYPRFQEGGPINFGAQIAKKLMEDFSGMSSAAAAGIAGNMHHESNGFIPDIREGGPFSGGSKPWPPGSHKGYGWAQWTGSRHDDFVNRFIGSFDKRATNQDNYSMLSYELKKPGAGFIGQTLAGYNKHTSPAAAAVDFRKTWERAGVAHDSRRISAANKIIAKIGGAPDLDWQASDPGSGATSESGGFLGFLRNKIGFLQNGGMVVTSGMGRRGFALSPGMHMGVDIAPSDGKEGHPLQAFTDGVVEATSPPSASAGYGNWINWIDKNGVGHLYAHMQKAPTVRAGTKVKKGTILGYLGNTGVSSGPHLHWETARNPKDTGMPKSAVLSRFNPLSKYGKDAPFGGSITPDSLQAPRGPFTGQDSMNMASASSSSSSSGVMMGLSAEEIISSGGITSAANIAALTKVIMALGGDVGKAGGGGMFGGAMGGIQPVAPAGSNPAPNPVSTAQGAANPTSGGGLSLSSSSTVNRNNEAKGEMR